MLSNNILMIHIYLVIWCQHYQTTMPTVSSSCRRLGSAQTDRQGSRRHTHTSCNLCVRRVTQLRKMGDCDENLVASVIIITVTEVHT